VDFRSETKAIVLLYLGHIIRGENIREEWGYVGKSKLESV
jgi:hypothetical protein